MKKINLIALLSLILLSSCAPTDHSESNLIDLEGFFNGKENRYGVYYFSENCPNCVNTKPYINKYLDKIAAKPQQNFYLENIYFVDALVTPIHRYQGGLNKETYKTVTIGVDNINTLTTMGYPELFIVEKVNNKNVVVDVKVGEKETTDFIKSIW